MTIEPNGNVGIGTVNPTARLSVSGTANKPGGGLWTAFSDQRLKENIRPYMDGLDEVLQIEPVRFNYNAKSGYDIKDEHVGVVAQQLESIAPYMISKFQLEGEEYLQVDNSAMIYMLINAVQEQQELIEKLSKRLDGLVESTAN